jgi:hypothetical protein
MVTAAPDEAHDARLSMIQIRICQTTRSRPMSTAMVPVTVSGMGALGRGERFAVVVARTADQFFADFARGKRFSGTRRLGLRMGAGFDDRPDPVAEEDDADDETLRETPRREPADVGPATLRTGHSIHAAGPPFFALEHRRPGGEPTAASLTEDGLGVAAPVDLREAIRDLPGAAARR